MYIVTSECSIQQFSYRHVAVQTYANHTITSLTRSRPRMRTYANRKEFEMDPEIKRQLALETEQKIAQVKREMAWEEEKHRIALEKLQQRFKHSVECERIVVKAFNSAHEVSSFRAAKLPSDFYQTKAEMDKRKTTMFSQASEAAKQTSDLKLGACAVLF